MVRYFYEFTEIITIGDFEMYKTMPADCWKNIRDEICQFCNGNVSSNDVESKLRTLNTFPGEFNFCNSIPCKDYKNVSVIHDDV